MASPFDIYLKALSLLLNANNIKREFDADPPVYYQQYLATCAVHQINAYRGSLMVIATGLGKTIIGAEVAGILSEAKEVQHVILLAPNIVHDAWADQLKGRGVSYTAFDYKILFQPYSKQKHFQIYKLLRWLRKANKQTLLVIDEAHIYRNQLSPETRKKGYRALKRVQVATEKGMKVLLLTGSAYATNKRNLDSLLSFLPASNTENLLGKEVWETESHKTFSTLSPVVVFSYPHVLEMVQARGDVEGSYPYLEYGGKRHYVPTDIHTEFVKFDLPEEGAIAEAFENKCFNQNKRRPLETHIDELGDIESATDGILNTTIDSLLSSTPSLIQCIENNLLTPGPQSPPLLFDELIEEEETNQGITSYVQGSILDSAPEEVCMPEEESTHAKPYNVVLKQNIGVRI